MAVRILHYSDLENAYDDPDRVSRLVRLVDARRDDETLVVGSGDVLAPSVLSLVTDGGVPLDVFESLDPEAETFGNHDFDLGVDTLAEVVTESPQTWLATNVAHETGVLSNAGAESYIVVDRGATTVGVLGVTTPKLPKMNHKASSVCVRDPVSAVEEYAHRLRSNYDVDAVIVLSHLGNERNFVERLDTSVDCVLGGHNHDTISTTVDGTLVARPGVNGTHVVEMTLGDQPVVTHHSVADTARNPTILTTFREYLAMTGLTDTVAAVSDPITLKKAAGARGESRIGNFVTDAYRWQSGADVALIAARAIRSGDILAGDVTPFDLIKLVPFDDRLVVLELSGSRLIDSFRELAHEDAPTMRDWYFGHVSGAELVWSREHGLDRVQVVDSPVDASATYEVATSSYFVETDHIFSAFGEADVVESCGTQYEALVNYADIHGIDPELEGRMVRPDESQ